MFKLQLTQYRYRDNLNVLLVLQVYRVNYYEIN